MRWKFLTLICFATCAGCRKDAPFPPEFILEYFKGTHRMDIYKYSMGIMGIQWDSTYSDNIEFTRSNSFMVFNYQEDNISMELYFSGRDSIKGIDSYSFHGGPGSSNDYCKVELHYMTDSIIVMSHQGGRSVGPNWYMKGKRQ